MKRQEAEMTWRHDPTDRLPRTGRTPGLAAGRLQAGDLVRVRSRRDIEATLDRRGELFGCLPMAEMWRYCGTVQRVLKPMIKYLDEHDYKVRQCRGIVLLENVVCQGSAYPEGCDCSCFFFWREEWLEKIV